jgi:hypothetical protein
MATLLEMCGHLVAKRYPNIKTYPAMKVMLNTLRSKQKHLENILRGTTDRIQLRFLCNTFHNRDAKKVCSWLESTMLAGNEVAFTLILTFARRRKWCSKEIRHWANRGKIVFEALNMNAPDVLLKYGDQRTTVSDVFNAALQTLREDIVDYILETDIDFIKSLDVYDGQQVYKANLSLGYAVAQGTKGMEIADWLLDDYLICTNRLFWAIADTQNKEMFEQMYEWLPSKTYNLSEEDFTLLEWVLANPRATSLPAVYPENMVEQLKDRKILRQLRNRQWRLEPTWKNKIKRPAKVKIFTYDRCFEIAIERYDVPLFKTIAKCVPIPKCIEEMVLEDPWFPNNVIQ